MVLPEEGLQPDDGDEDIDEIESVSSSRRIMDPWQRDEYTGVSRGTHCNSGLLTGSSNMWLVATSLDRAPLGVLRLAPAAI